MPKRPAAPASRARRVDARTRTAYHEAGHAVLSTVIANKPEHVSIRPKGHSLGRTRAWSSVRLSSRVQVHLAGYAAEHLLTGRRSPQYEPDLRFAIVARLDAALRAAFVGSEDRDGHHAVEEVLKIGVYESDDDIKWEVDRFYDIARESLSAVWRAVDSVAKALLKHEELDRDGIDDALGDCDIYAPVFAVQRMHGLLHHLASPPVAPDATVVNVNMTAKATKKPARPAANDPRVAALLKALRTDPTLAPVVDAFEESRKVATAKKFGSNGLKVNGKLFALFTQGTLVVKLPKERVAALAAARVGKNFDPGRGRLMKEWLTVTSKTASWVELAKEAHGFLKA